MTQTDDTCRGGRPSGVRPPGAGRIAARRRRVSSDAVVSAYIRDIARPYADGKQRDPTPPSSPPPPLERARAIEFHRDRGTSLRRKLHATGCQRP